MAGLGHYSEHAFWGQSGVIKRGADFSRKFLDLIWYCIELDDTFKSWGKHRTPNTEHKGSHMTRTDAEFAKVKDVERRIACEFVIAALGAGYCISVDNGGDDYEISYSTDYTAIIGAMFATDDERLYVHKCTPQKTGKQYTSLGWAWFVYGENGWDVICDNSVGIVNDQLIESGKVAELVNKYSEAM